MAKKSSKNCVECRDIPCCADHCGPASFSLGVTLAVVYLVAVLISYLVPAFYSYIGFSLFHGSIPISVGDFSVTTVISGIIGWFLVGAIINAVYFYSKKLFKYK